MRRAHAWLACAVLFGCGPTAQEHAACMRQVAAHRRCAQSLTDARAALAANDTAMTNLRGELALEGSTMATARLAARAAEITAADARIRGVNERVVATSAARPALDAHVHALEAECAAAPDPGACE